ncbi:MAG: hypothetical protein FD127_2044, partial [Acidimicrobiaceae bacterium]
MSSRAGAARIGIRLARGLCVAAVGLFGLLLANGTYNRDDPAPVGSSQVVLSGLGSAPYGLMLSPSGTWQVVAASGALFISQDGVSWANIGVPSGVAATGFVAIDDSGTVFMTVAGTGNYRPTLLYTYASSWTGPVTVLSGIVNIGQGPAGIVTDGSKLVALERATGRTAVSTNGGTTWAIAGSVSGGTGYSTTVIGGFMHVISASGVYSRWSFSSMTSTATLSGLAPSSRVMSSPGSTSHLWAMAADSVGLSLRESTDSGATWTAVASNEMMPVRSTTFASPMMRADGVIGTYGSEVVSGTVSLVDFGRNPAVSTVSNPLADGWSDMSRLATSVTYGALTVSPGQLVSGGVVDPIRLVTQSRTVGSSTVYDVYLISGAATLEPWSVVSSSSNATALIEGMAGQPGVVVFSPSGTWRVIAAGASVYRSADGSNWTNIGVPSGSSGLNVAIGDDGTVYASRSGTGTYKNTLTYRFTSDWFGPRTALSFPSNVSAGASGIYTDGSKLIVLERATGRTAVSIDSGNSWALGGSVTGSVYGYQGAVLGGYLHVWSSNGSGSHTLNRWSLATHATTTTTSFTGWQAQLLPASGSTSHLWLAAGHHTTGTQSLYESTDSGSTWTAVTSWTGAAAQRFDRDTGDVRGLATAACSTGSFVYGMEHPLGVGSGWGPYEAFQLGATGSPSVVQSRGRVDGVMSDADDVWYSVQNGSTWDLYRVDPTALTPEAVYGNDGYAVTVGGVNTAIRGHVESWTDVKIAGVGPSLELTRTYNSQDRRIGIFGRGWTSTFETRAFENCVTKDVTVLYADGRRETHRWNGTSYVTPAGHTTKLTKTGSTGWKLTGVDGIVRTFRTDGRMTSIADADAQALNLSWNGSGQLTTVTDVVSGRTLTFTYTSGLVSSVATNSVTSAGVTAPLVWNYTYSGQDLAKVCEPRNNNV